MTSSQTVQSVEVVCHHKHRPCYLGLVLGLLNGDWGTAAIQEVPMSVDYMASKCMVVSVGPRTPVHSTANREFVLV